MSIELPPGPWVVTFEEYGGYDMMTSAYAVRNAKGGHLFSIDIGHFGENPKYRATAEAAARGWEISQTSVRRKAIADVIELVRSERVTHPSQQIDMESEELVEMIQALAGD